MNINQADLNELEFPELLAEIAPFAYSPKTADNIMELRPMEIDEAELSLKKTSEFLTSFESSNAIPFDEYEDIEEELKLMLIENYRLENKSFIKIKTITEQIGKLQKFFPQFSEAFPTLLEEVKDLEFRKEIIDKVDKVFNRFGDVKSDASAVLKTLRTEIQHARKAVDENFNRSLATYSEFLEDIRESIIEDQRVLAVKSGFKKRVNGRVLGISKTGSITFMQPESVVKHYFKLKENQEEEKKEIDKILRKLTAELSEFQPQLSDYQTYIFDLDLIRAKAKFAEKVNGILPKINRHQTLRLKDAFHPLL